MATERLDTTVLDLLGEQWDRDCAGAMAAGLVYLGDRLGLFAALRGAGPITSEELAARTGLVERYVREWLAAMAAAEYVAFDPVSGRFTLTPEQAAVFADSESLSFATPVATFMVGHLAQADRIADAFRRGGGVPLAAYGEDYIAEMDRANYPEYHAFLVTNWLPAMPGAVERLMDGGSFLDVGCGGGIACVEVARAFPSARVLGLDRHAPSIERARTRARTAEVEGRVHFDTTPVGELGSDMRFDVVTSFDVVHDLADPVSMLRAVRDVVAPGGGYLMVENKISDLLQDNIGTRGKMEYGVSLFHCLTQSLAENGLGLGGCMGPETARSLALQAGFASFTVLPIPSAGRAFYHLRA